jgi:hypothetical protein
MISEQWIVMALYSLGYTTGWAVRGEEIILWENEAPQPTIAELEVILPR